MSLYLLQPDLNPLTHMQIPAWNTDSSPSKRDISQLTAYLRRELPLEVEREITREMTQDELLHDALLELRQAQQEDPLAIDRAYRYRGAFCQELQEIQKRSPGPPTPVWRHRFQVSLAAAISLLILLIPSWWIAEKSPSSGHQLATLLEAPVADAARGGSEPGAYEFAAAMQQYQEAHFEEAARWFTRIIQEYPQSPLMVRKASYYLGVSQLMAGHPERALGPLNRIRSDDPNPWQAGATYYLGWAHLRLGEKQTAREYFEMVAIQPSRYQAKAERVLALLHQ
ncbi:MAG: tetratricopeptide repeat protein [Bacteroidota bacterium]